MSYKYEDPKFRNLTIWMIGDEKWQVTGVWAIADDDSGRNARTQYLGVQLYENGRYKTDVIQVKKDDFQRSINAKKVLFRV